MAGTILYDNIVHSYIDALGSNIVPLGTDINDLNIKIVQITPVSVDILKATDSRIQNLTTETLNVGSMQTPAITSSNITSNKLIIK